MSDDLKMDTGLQITMVSVTKDIEYIKKDIADIKMAIERVSNVFATKEEMKEFSSDTEKRLIALEEKKSLWRYMNPLVSAAISSAVTFLLIAYIESKGGAL